MMRYSSNVEGSAAPPSGVRLDTEMSDAALSGANTPRSLAGLKRDLIGRGGVLEYEIWE